MTDRPPPGDDREAPELSVAEEAALAGSVRRIGGGGRGPLVASALIVVAFAIGLIRPWDFLFGAPVAPDGGPPAASAVPGGTGSPGPGDGSGGPPADDVVATCGYPQSWRSATIQRWAGRPARVWSAVEAVEASGPDDPSIPFQPVAGEDFTALGWCAPVEGPERPPLAASAQLFRLEGEAMVEVPHERLEPPEPDALGELWQPIAVGGAHGEWAPGRYVFRLATPTGAYVRYLGLDIGPAHEPTGTPAATDGSPSPSPSP